MHACLRCTCDGGSSLASNTSLLGERACLVQPGFYLGVRESVGAPLIPLVPGL